jgi:hypothetical protein
MLHTSICQKSVVGSALALAMYAATFPGVANADNSRPTLVTGTPSRLVIRLINADTGEPMSHQNVLVEWDADAEESIVYVGGKGRGTLEILAGGQNFTLKPGVKDYGDPNRLAYFSCSGPVVAVEAQQARRSGFVARNLCNDRTATAAPGEIVFWARPLPLLKPDFQ